MMLRCSKCKGTFETEPNPRKDVVFCPHCGAPLQIRGSHVQHSQESLQDMQSLAALAGEKSGAAGASVQAVTTSPGHGALPARPPSPIAGGGVSAAEEPEPAPAAADPLAALSSATTHAGPAFRSTPRLVHGVRRRQSSSNGPLIAILIGAALLVVIVIAGALIIMTRQPEPEKRRPTHDPGELFPNKAPEPSKQPEDSPPPG